MIAIALALASAAAYGLSDFLGGVLSRRTSPWAVGVVGQASGMALIVALGLLLGGDPRWEDAGWGAVAGLGNGAGVAFLYRGLSRGRMGVVAPASGVVAAVIPVAVGLFEGERPSIVVLLGMLIALPGIWLVAAAPAGAEEAARPSGLLDGLGAGAGFGLLFATTAQIPADSGVLPLAAMQAVAVLVLIVGALAAGAAWRPRGRAALGGAWCGLLGSSAVALFLTATHHGYLTVVAVIAALYPAATVLLAATVLRERIHRSQGLGLGLCAVAVVCVAAG
ncbi:DMT family transporter [Nocardioides fonticola]|uniref:DMT family transporter n=1 Tax=Nocardioides fonticola TaxID=450363 RepID=A0ABP7Y0A2_9ACTN